MLADTPMEGRWLVTTQTARYLLDLDAGTALRQPEGGGTSHQKWGVASLRRDHQPMRLVGVAHLQLNEPMVLLLALVRGAATVRATTPVLSCQRLSGASHDVAEGLA